MKIHKHHGKYNISKRSKPPNYIVIHYVGAGTSAIGSALANCKYFAGGNRNASAHYFIDEGFIYEYADPDTHYTWHCGDGHGKNGITNANSIGIEVCQNGDKPFTTPEIKLLGELVRYLMDKYDIPKSRIVRHYDASGKMCPLYYAKRHDAWIELKNKITQQAPTTKPKPKPVDESLALDGKVGKLTVTKWQKIMKCSIVDGIISGQSNATRLRHTAIKSIKYSSEKKGSNLIRAVQKQLECKPYDGLLGRYTITAIQTHLQCRITGTFDKQTAIALQKQLNHGRF